MGRTKPRLEMHRHKRPGGLLQRRQQVPMALGTYVLDGRNSCAREHPPRKVPGYDAVELF